MSAAALTAAAQDSPPVPAVPADPAGPPGAPPADEAVILDRLTGVVFVGSIEAFDPGGAAAAGVEIRGSEPLDDPRFIARIEPFIGRPVTLARLNEIARLAVLFFREQNRPLADVVVPEQDISNGVVQILALEFRAGRIRAEGNEWFADELLLGQLRVEPGETIDVETLLADIAWLNRNPFRRSDVLYERGQGFGETDIVLRTVDRIPLRALGGVDNTGTAATGHQRYVAGVTWGNAFGLGHQLFYQFSASSDVRFGRLPHGPAARAPRTFTHSASYSAPLPWRHVLSLSGSYAEARPELPAVFDSSGRSWQISGRYGVPLPSVEWSSDADGEAGGALTHDLQIGADFKRSNNDLEFGGQRISDSDTDIAQAVLAYIGREQDRWGETFVDVGLHYSPGNLTPFNEDRFFQPSETSTGRSFAEARYGYARLSLDRRTPLPGGFRLRLSGRGQIASGNLLASEQLVVGGSTGVRGFPESEGNGDGGFVANVELATPETALAPRLGFPGVDDGLSGLLFFDYGKGIIEQPLPGERRVRTLSSVGVGLRYRLAGNVDLAVDHGWQLQGRELDPGGERKTHFRLIVSY